MEKPRILRCLRRRHKWRFHCRQACIAWRSVSAIHGIEAPEPPSQLSQPSGCWDSCSSGAARRKREATRPKTPDQRWTNFEKSFRSWLGGLDSNQDSQLQRLMYCQLYDLPAEGRQQKGPRARPFSTLPGSLDFVNRAPHAAAWESDRSGVPRRLQSRADRPSSGRTGRCIRIARHRKARARDLDGPR
jgi:hypothetical protein